MPAEILVQCVTGKLTAAAQSTCPCAPSASVPRSRASTGDGSWASPAWCRVALGPAECLGLACFVSWAAVGLWAKAGPV
jgi:hypothetical protein